jgi:hypothetical protein
MTTGSSQFPQPITLLVYPLIRTNLADLLRAYSDLDAAIAHLTIAAGIFAGIGADAGELRPKIWERTEW